METLYLYIDDLALGVRGRSMAMVVRANRKANGNIKTNSTDMRMMGMGVGEIRLGRGPWA